MKNKVTASAFLNWYFSDKDEVYDFGKRCIRMLNNHGIVNIDVKILFDECVYIPDYICEDFDGDYGADNEYAPQELEFINDLSQ